MPYWNVLTLQARAALRQRQHVDVLVGGHEGVQHLVEGELGVRAVKVMNNTAQQITCEFHVPAEARSDTSAPPVFSVAPNTQRTERVPGDYSPDRPFAEVTCRSSDARGER